MAYEDSWWVDLDRLVAEMRDPENDWAESMTVEELKKVSLSGERVNLYFEKHYLTFPWRGDTKYFVTRVERLGN